MESFYAFGEYVLKHSRHNEIPSDKVHIILNYPKIQWDDWAEYMATLTWFSGIPLSRGGSKTSHVIFAETIDEALNQSDKYDYAMISYIGSFYYSDHEDNIFEYFDEFCKSERTCRGHLLFHPEKQYGRLHPQTIFLNIKNWRNLGRPTFDNYTGQVIEYVRSESNVHDDYTPHWVKGGEQYKNVIHSEQAKFISDVLESGETILNFDKQRSVKFFCYPERRQSNTLDEERNRKSDIIYTVNNETLTQLPILDKKFDVIYAPASGQTSEYLYHIYGHKDTKLIIYDNNLNSLSWKQMVYCMASENNLKQIDQYFRNKGCIIDDCSYKPELVEKNESIYSRKQWFEDVYKIKPTFKQYDLLETTIDVDPSKTNLIYLSNIFSYNFCIHKYKIEDIHNRFIEYTNLPNTTIYGKNIFKDTVYHENSLR
jgi:hypothetical protein